MTTPPPQSHFDLKPELFDALLGTELLKKKKKQKESLFSNCGFQLNRLEERNKPAMLVEHAGWLFIPPGCSAQLLPWAFSSLPPPCAHSAFLSTSLKSTFFNQWVYFPTSDFLHWLGGCHLLLGFYLKLTDSKKACGGGDGRGTECLWCFSTAPAGWKQQ